MKLSLAGKGQSQGMSLGNKGKHPANAAAPKNAFGKPAAAKTAKKAFADDDDEDEEEGNNDEPIASTSKLASSGKAKRAGVDPTRPYASSNNANPSRILKKLHDEATSADPSIFSYDEVYDSMKAGAQAAEQARKAAKEQEGDKPKYVNQLLAAAELRKKDRIRAEDKLIERERDKEGDEFVDKEAFVTSAYKEQQAELRKAEEEERIKEEQQTKRPGGMAEYYKRELAKSEAVHAAAVAAASSDATTSSLAKPIPNSAQAELAARGPKSEAAIAAEASASLGKRIDLNDEGQIIDKRELLTGGLNLKPKKKLGPEAPEELKGFALSIAERKQLNAQEEIAQREKERKAREDEHSLGLTGLTVAERHRISRERQSRELEKQMLEMQDRKRKADEEKDKETVKKVQKRNNDESKVEEMKRRAMERRMQKKQEEEQQQVAMS